MENEITLWNQLAVPSLSKLSYFYEGEIIHLIEKFYSEGLDEAVDKAGGESELLKLAIKLGEAVIQLHTNDIVHGCISPSHTFLEKERMVLNGCGLHSLRKYLSLITGYTNKSMYTAIEHLRDKNNVILKPQKPADIYSFGIVLY
jgi:serine/threonine protein kinase